MLDDSNAPIETETPEAPLPEEKSNRTFWIVGGVLAGLVFLTLVCIAVYFYYLAPRWNAQRTAAQQTIEAGNAQAIQQLTLTAAADKLTPVLQNTPLPLKTGTPVPPTLAATSTPVIAQNSPAATSTTDPATLVAMQTQLSVQLTSTAAAISTAGSTGMPATGFFDEVGLPSMIILAFVLVVVIFLARRMRRPSEK